MINWKSSFTKASKPCLLHTVGPPTLCDNGLVDIVDFDAFWTRFVPHFNILLEPKLDTVWRTKGVDILASGASENFEILILFGLDLCPTLLESEIHWPHERCRYCREQSALESARGAREKF